MTNEYIEKIESLLPYADEDLLDFVFQLLQKSISPSQIETQTQPAWHLQAALRQADLTLQL